MMYAILRALGIMSWTGCILTLLYQAVTWVFTAKWPSVSAMDAIDSLLDIDMGVLISNLPFSTAFKATYILTVTELSLFLWYAGAFFLLSAFSLKILFRK